MILHAVAMYGPGNNEIVLSGLEDVLCRYPYVNCFIYDRARKILKDDKARRRSMWKIKTYAGDKFHGVGRKSSCPINPYSSPQAMRRLRGVNTVVGEQAFPWFRRYARRMGELKPERRQFLVPIYAEGRNKLLAIGETSRLNPYRKSGLRRPIPYERSDRRQTNRARRTYPMLGEDTCPTTTREVCGDDDDGGNLALSVGRGGFLCTDVVADFVST